jgi:hypothetical protein
MFNAIHAALGRNLAAQHSPGKSRYVIISVEAGGRIEPITSAPTGGNLQHQSAITRLSRGGFSAMTAVGGVRVIPVVAAMSARAGATFISFNRARTCGVRRGKDATGVKLGVWSVPTRVPE